MSLDSGDYLVDLVTKSFFVAIFSNTDCGKIAFVFVYEGKIGGDVGDEGETRFFGGGGVVSVDLIAEIGEFCDATHFGKMTNDEFFGVGEFGDLIVGRVDTEPDQDGFF